MVILFLRNIFIQVDSYWINESIMNNLNDVYQYYCGGRFLEKVIRDVFVKGSMVDVRDMYQVSLILYCIIYIKIYIFYYKQVLFFLDLSKIFSFEDFLIELVDRI